MKAFPGNLKESLYVNSVKGKVEVNNFFTNERANEIFALDIDQVIKLNKEQ